MVSHDGWPDLNAPARTGKAPEQPRTPKLWNMWSPSSLTGVLATILLVFFNEVKEMHSIRRTG